MALVVDRSDLSDVARRQALVRIVVVVQSQTNLFEIVCALASPRRFARRLNRWQQKRNQNANNRNHPETLSFPVKPRFRDSEAEMPDMANLL